MYNCLSACEHIPVKLEAAIALSKLLKNDICEKILRPGLGEIIENFMNLTNQIDSEELVAAFETFMQVFSDDMGPHAIKIVTHLVEQYKRLV
jgi:hypothetical protein